MGLLSQSISSALVYGGVYRALARAFAPGSPYGSPEYRSRAVSVVSAAVLVIGSTLYLAQHLPAEATTWVLQASPIGYSVYGLLLMCAEPALFDAPTLSRYAALAYFPAFVFAEYPADVALGYLSECCIPGLYLCWHYHQARRTDSVLRRAAGFYLLATTLFFRVGAFHWLTYRAAAEGQYFAAATTGAFTALNTCWFRRLAQRETGSCPYAAFRRLARRASGACTSEAVYWTVVWVAVVVVHFPFAAAAGSLIAVYAVYGAYHLVWWAARFGATDSTDRG